MRRIGWEGGGIAGLQLCGYLSVTTDVVFMGWFADVTSLAAMGLCLAFQSCVGFFAYNLASLGLFTLISQAHGRNDLSAKALALQTALAVGLFVSLLLSPLLWFTADILALMPGLSPQLLPLLSLGGKLGIPQVVFETLYRAMEAALINQRLANTCLVIQASSLLLNALLNVLFVSALHLGYLGSLIGTILMKFARLVFMALIVGWVPSVRSQVWAPWTRQCLSPTILKPFLRHSIPSALTVSMEVLGFEGVTFVAGAFGVVSSAAHVAAFQILVIVFFIVFGITNAMNVAVGNMLGAGDLKAALVFVKVGSFMALGAATLNCSLVLMLRYQLPWVFAADPAVVALAASIMPIIAFCHVPDTLIGIAASILRSVGRSWGSTVATIVGMGCCTFPLAWVFGFHLGYGLVGVWMALGCGTWLIVFVDLVFLMRIDWRLAVEEGTQDLVGVEMMRADDDEGGV